CAAPRVPHPGEIALLLAVEPVHERVEVRGVAVVSADLGAEEWHLRGNGGRGAVIAGDAAAVVEVVHVPRCREVVQGVYWFVGEPMRKCVAVLHTSKGDTVRWAGRANGVHERLHASDLK